MSEYSSYQPTDLPWVKKVPQHWRLIRNGALLSWKQNKVGESFSQFDLLSLTTTGIRVKDINDVRGKVPASYEGYQEVLPGEMVFCLFDLDCSAVFAGKSNHHGMITSAYDVAIPNESEVNPSFLDYWFISVFAGRHYKIYSKSVRYTINWDIFKAIKLPVSPRAEQDQIVRYLDWQVSKINKLIAAKKKQIALYEEQKFTLVSSEFQKLCKLTTARLALRAIKIGSGKTPRGGATVYSTEGVLFIRSQNVYPSGVITDGAYYISQEIDSEMASTRVYRGDVLLNITGGSIGRACAYDLAVPANVNQHVCIIRVDEKFLIPEFVSLYLNSKCGQDLIWGNQKPGNRQSLTFPQIGSFPIPVLSTKEQERFVDSIMDRGQSISSIVKSINTEIDTLHELRTRIISDVVTGQIDVRNIEVPEFEMVEEIDESADEDDISEETEEQEED